ncbi:MAG: glycoside hydrolase family 3 protein [Sphingobacteriaceae bacterium]
MRYQLLLLICLLIAGEAGAQNSISFIESLNHPNPWADSVFHKLSRKQRIAQLFFVRAHTDKGKAYEDSIARVILKEKIGGLVFFQGGPVRQAQLTQQYQHLAKVPLLIAMDGEWGLGMRLDSCISYPYQMTLGAIQDNHLIELMGQHIAFDFKKIGAHINFAPDADVNNNPKNPVIGFRSFGDDKYKVAQKAAAYMRGMQQENLLVSLKHFPGHGDTDVDSHYDLPQLKFSRERLDSLELYPFKELIKQGASGVMVAHMQIPALDNTPNLPSTLSKPIVTELLKEQLGFKGLVFSDAMGMKGVVKFFPNGEADVRAIIAGNDVLELSENSKRAVKLIRKAIRNKRISWGQINSSVKKVLAAKYWAGLNKPIMIETDQLISTLNQPESVQLNQQLADAAVTVLNGQSGIKSLNKDKKTLILSIGQEVISPFQQNLKAYFSNAELQNLGKQATQAALDAIQQQLRNYEQIIVGIHDTRKRPAPVLDFSLELGAFISQLAHNKAIINVFANPYTLIQLPGMEKTETLLMNYQNSEEMQKAAAKVIAGIIPSKGKLPVNINSYFRNGDGL